MPTLEANGCEMYYEIDDFTDPWTDVETILLQHGTGRSTRFWYPWVPALARNYRVVRRDMRGHGRSSVPSRDHLWSLDELAEDLHSFMDAVGLERVHYLGESVGGISGIIFAQRWPERLKSLTLCSTPSAFEGPEHGLCRDLMARLRTLLRRWDQKDGGVCYLSET